MQREALARWAYEPFFGGAAVLGESEHLVVAPLRRVDRPTFLGLLLRNSFPEPANGSPADP